MFRDVTVLTLGTGLAQLINIGSAPLLSRLYSPKDFGILAIFLAIVGISSTLVTLRYETAILIPRSKKESANIVAMSIFLAVVGSVLLMLISLVLSDTMSEYFGISEIKYWLPIIFIVAGLSAMITTIQSWLNREKKYFNIIAIRIAQNTFIVAISIICFYFGSMSGLILSQIISLSLTFIIALYFIRNLTELIDLNKIKINFKTYSNAPKYLLPTAILDTISIQLPILMIASLFGERITGQFSMAWKILAVPMTLIGVSVGQVFMQKFSECRNDIKASKELVKKTWISLVTIGLLPTTIIMTLGEEFFTLLLGEKWYESGTIASILAPMTLMMLISSPTSGVYIILGMQKISLFFGVAVFLYRPACLIYGYYIDNLYIGLKIWVILEILQITVYQYLSWNGIKKGSVN